MGGKIGIGKSGVAIAAAIALAMCIISFIFRPVDIFPVQYGLCLDSPDSWRIAPVLSWILNVLLIAVITLLLYLVNKSYNFIRTTEPVLTALFPIMAASSPWFAQALCTSNLLCLFNVVGLGIVFSAYGSKNATQQLFIAGVTLGAGAMFQYAFIPMIAVYILWALFMKVLRLKELLAFFVGILCPWWIMLGFGLISFSDFRLPSLVPFFGLERDHTDIFFLLIGIGLAVIIGLLTALSNFMKLYAGNSRVNAMNLCLYTLGAACVICILIDYENIPAYVITLYMVTAVQVANICALWNIARPWLVTALPSLLFVLLFIGNMLV